MKKKMITRKKIFIHREYGIIKYIYIYIYKKKISVSQLKLVL